MEHFDLRVTSEIITVKGQDGLDTVCHRRGNESGVVRLQPGDTVQRDEPFPFREDLGPFEESEVLIIPLRKNRK